MMSVNVTGCFMTAQAAAKQMVRFGNGGSIVMIASMSGTIANRVRIPFSFPFIPFPRHPLPNSNPEMKHELTRGNRASSAPPTTPPKQP